LPAVLEHRFHRRVQFHETDLAGMAHFSGYFLYMEEAEHDLWRQAGLSIASPDDNLRFLRVAASCDFRAPLRFEDEFEVRIRIAALGSRTIKYACELTRGDTRIASGSMTVACVDIAAKPPRAVDIPKRIADGLASR
jgi:4-hydroxybenzoyl-CoA thioesterase/acyl-CoA thioester hydrolase